LLAAGGSYWLVSRWPDIIVGCIIASLFLGSAVGVLRQAIQVLRMPRSSGEQAVKPVAVELSKLRLR
jgi:Co/Zn/Cd efflux system component